MKGDCSHENIAKLEYRRPGLSAVHGPYYEIWLVRCEDCGKELEESICDEPVVC